MRPWRRYRRSCGWNPRRSRRAGRRCQRRGRGRRRPRWPPRPCPSVPQEAPRRSHAPASADIPAGNPWLFAFLSRLRGRTRAATMTVRERGEKFLLLFGACRATQKTSRPQGRRPSPCREVGLVMLLCRAPQLTGQRFCRLLHAGRIVHRISARQTAGGVREADRGAAVGNIGFLLGIHHAGGVASAGPQAAGRGAAWGRKRPPVSRFSRFALAFASRVMVS